MILEIAILNIKPELAPDFPAAFTQAEPIITSIPGYISHQLQQCIETPNKYILLVHWETLESHTINFRQSPKYKTWKKLLHHYYDPFPTVEHYKLFKHQS